MPKRHVVIGLYGTNLDRSAKRDGMPLDGRWDRWRPTLTLAQQEDFQPDRLVLLTEKRFRREVEVLLEDIRNVSPETACEVALVNFRDPWDFADVYTQLSAFATDFTFDEDEEQYYLHITTGTHVAQICWFLLAESRHVPATLVQSSPEARQRGQRPLGRLSFIDLDLSKYDKLAARFEARHAEGADFLKAGIATESPAYNRVIEELERVASRSDAPILLTGPTGVGKTQLARRISELKRTQDVRGAFVEVNCATLRGDGAMSALFGHTKGAFTGAVAAREGLLKSADGGVLFLDEIGELGLDEQAMLLRAIEEGVWLPLGADRPVRGTFQLIAGTNRELGAEVAAGRFREDLLARINLWTFALPALAERREDLAPNLEHELARFAAATGRRVTLNRDARRRFLAFASAPDTPWRANFRDFAAAVTRMATMAAGGRVGVQDVKDEIARLERQWGGLAGEPVQPDVLAGLVEADGLDLFDRAQLAEVVRVCRTEPSLAAAGRRLFAVSRARKASNNDSDRLKKYLARFGLDWARVRG